MFEVRGKCEWSDVRPKMVGGVYFVAVQDVLDMVANRAMLMVRELAKPHHTGAHDDLLRGALQELQQIETALYERNDD